jgi:response regulator RpfG family c-di-GMP phosphodiesterase
MVAEDVTEGMISAAAGMSAIFRPDVFDAMTCHRPYRRPISKADACVYLNKYAGVWFDAEIVACWIDHVRSAE